MEEFDSGALARHLATNFDVSLTDKGLIRWDGVPLRKKSDISDLIRTVEESVDDINDPARLAAITYLIARDTDQAAFRKALTVSLKAIPKPRKDHQGRWGGNFDPAEIELVTILGDPAEKMYCSMDGILIPEEEFSVSNFSQLDAGLFAEAKKRVNLGTIKYDPTKPDFWEEDWKIGYREIKGLKHFNRHISPAWRYQEISDPQLPVEIHAVMAHMVMDDREQLEYLYDCIHYILKDRLHVYLVLSGSPGIGKGIFGQILSLLLGDTNVKDAPKGALRSSFNDLFSETRLVMHDEYPAATREEIASLKKNIENKQSIQRKFRDSQNLEKIWASQLITVNKGIRYAFEPNERKFSVLDLNNVPLLDVMSETEINGITGRLNNDLEYLANIGHFFLNRKPKHSSRKPFLGKRFWQMVVAGLSGFNRFLYSTLRERYEKEIPLNQIFKMFQEARRGNRYEEPTDEEALAHLEMWNLAGKPIAQVSRREGKVILRSIIEPSELQDADEAEMEAYSDEEIDDGFDNL